MTIRTNRIRLAETRDAEGVAAVHDAAWREAYRGIIPGQELERMVERRGARWWAHAIARGSRIVVLDVGETIVGYASYGRNRALSLPYKGEIFELYLKPEYQGLGFGRRLFRTAHRELVSHGMGSVVVWSLAENDRAVAFYEQIGGLLVGRAHETFGQKSCERLAFGWQ
jgi:ribosomal protein S18 acetylase RimI-like enzyme